MPNTMPYDDLQTHYLLFDLENHSPEWPLFKSPESTRILKEQAQSYGGRISISHFIRAFSELKASGEIVQLRQPRPSEPEEFSLTAAEYHRLSAHDVTVRYRKDPEFRAAVDELITTGAI